MNLKVNKSVNKKITGNATAEWKEKLIGKLTVEWCSENVDVNAALEDTEFEAIGLWNDAVLCGFVFPVITFEICLRLHWNWHSIAGFVKKRVAI